MRTAVSTCSLCLALVSASSFADDGESTDDGRRLAYLVERLQELSLVERSDAKRPAELQAEPLMTWENPISGAQGGVFVWTIAGRPVALTKTHVNDRKQHRVETSIALSDRLRGTISERIAWSPQASEARDVPITDEAPPAAVKAARTLQMRSIARRFEIEDEWGEESQLYQLRLMPRPLYRFESPEERVIDGAIFGYSQGTNPEAIVLIEAVETDEGTAWRCAVSRMTGYAVRARWHGELVLDVPLLRDTGPESSFRHVYERLNPYPFDVDE